MTASALTVLQIAPTLNGGAVARATLDAAQAVIAAGGTALVASPGGDRVPELLRRRAVHLEMPPDLHPLWAGLTMPRKLAASLRHTPLSVIQARSPSAAWIARRLAARLGVRWIATLHEPLQDHGVVGRLLERSQLDAHAVLAVSAHLARQVEQRYPACAGRVEGLATGVDLDRFDPALVRADRLIRLARELRVPDGSLVVLCPTRFDSDHGQAVLVEAIERLANPDVFCLLPGSLGAPTAFERELERRIEQAGLQGRVQIGPFVEDMPAAYMLADVVVATGGARQGFSRALVEAQAMGRPVVAEDGGGAVETILPGVTGWLSPAGDADALAGVLGQALSLDGDRRADLARRARDHVRQRFDLGTAAESLLAAYRRLAVA